MKAEVIEMRKMSRKQMQPIALETVNPSEVARRIDSERTRKRGRAVLEAGWDSESRVGQMQNQIEVILGHAREHDFPEVRYYRLIEGRQDIATAGWQIGFRDNPEKHEVKRTYTRYVLLVDGTIRTQQTAGADIEEIRGDSLVVLNEEMPEENQKIYGEMLRRLARQMGAPQVIEA